MGVNGRDVAPPDRDDAVKDPDGDAGSGDMPYETSNATLFQTAAPPLLPSENTSKKLAHLGEKLRKFRARRRRPKTNNDRQHYRVASTGDRTSMAKPMQSVKVTPHEHANLRNGNTGGDGGHVAATLGPTVSRLGYLHPPCPTTPAPGSSVATMVNGGTARDPGPRPAASLENHGEMDDRSISQGYDDESSASDSESETGRQFARQWRSLREHRGAVNSTLRRMRTQQFAMQDANEERNKVYREINLAIQKLLPLEPSLVHLFNAAESSNLRCQAEETGFENSFFELEDKENQLGREERLFYTNEVTIRRPSSRASLRGITGIRQEDAHPLFEEFEDAVNEIRLAREWRASLRMRRKILLQLSNEDLAEDDQEFLEEFDDYQAQAESDLKHWMGVAEELEQRCRRMQVIPRNSPFQAEGYWRNPVQEEDNILDPIDNSPLDLRALAHPVYSHLLTNPRRLLTSPLLQTGPLLQTAEEMKWRELLFQEPDTEKEDKATKWRELLVQDAEKEKEIDSLLSSEYQNKREYINLWLLHKLRQSTMEVELLCTTFQSFLRILNMDKWQHDVLYYWNKDGTAS